MNALTVTWSVDSKSTPCYKYQIDIFIKSDLSYINLFTYISFKPEQTKYAYESNFKEGDYQIRMSCIAISNAKQLEVEFRDMELNV